MMILISAGCNVLDTLMGKMINVVGVDLSELLFAVVYETLESLNTYQSIGGDSLGFFEIRVFVYSYRNSPVFLC